MAIWNFNVTHQDQSTTTGSKDINPPGQGQPANIANVPCRCGFSHTLKGTQTNANAMSGTGIGSVVPGNDPRGARGGPEGDDVPSWDGSPSGLEGKTPGKKTASKKASGKKKSSKKTISKKTSSKKTSSKKISSKKTSGKKTSGKKKSSKKR